GCRPGNGRVNAFRTKGSYGAIRQDRSWKGPNPSPDDGLGVLMRQLRLVQPPDQPGDTVGGGFVVVGGVGHGAASSVCGFWGGSGVGSASLPTGQGRPGGRERADPICLRNSTSWWASPATTPSPCRSPATSTP